MHCYKKSWNNNTGHFMHCDKKPRNNNTGNFMHYNYSFTRVFILYIHWASFSNAVKKNLRGISSELDLGQHLAFMKVFSSGICSELQKTFRTRNSSRNSSRVFSNAIP